MCRPNGDGYGRPPIPQVDRSEVRPHLCTTRAGKIVRTRGAGSREVVVEFGGARGARTERIVAPACGVALPKLPIEVPAPALDGRVVLRREATEDH